MKRGLAVAAALLLLGVFALSGLAGDTLDDVRKKGVLVAGVKDSTPPFGYVDNRSGEIVGYDVDIAKAVADKLGVRLEIKPVTSLDRIPQLLGGNIDMWRSVGLHRSAAGHRRGGQGRVEKGVCGPGGRDQDGFRGGREDEESGAERVRPKEVPAGRAVGLVLLPPLLRNIDDENGK